MVFSLAACAEELLPKVQRELRARKFYFGEINGRATDETVGAIGKFQEAHGLDRTGNLDDETLHALGLPGDSRTNREEGRRLDECGNCVLRYLQAWQSGNWEREAAFFADVVNYYDDDNVGRDFIREVRARESRRWPHRKSTMLNRIASLEPGHDDQAQVTARVRTEVAGESGPAKARTEDLLFRLQKTNQGWRIAAVKLLE
ncbi:MAG: peptidoglycan-binding protein [Chthoniobacter sp.]|nr:peptidoglycan-binding protein [Chthoniobacter sp.]